jgi:serine/threonine protein kinase
MDLAHGNLKGVRFIFGLICRRQYSFYLQANIVVSEEGRACLTDVGLTRVTKNLCFSAAVATGGSKFVRWCAPELLVPDESKRGGPTKESDIYAMGMTIYEVSSL